MQEMDNVRVTVEKETYSRDGVHKGMQGWITEPENINGFAIPNASKAIGWSIFHNAARRMILLRSASKKKIWKSCESLTHA